MSSLYRWQEMLVERFFDMNGLFHLMAIHNQLTSVSSTKIVAQKTGLQRLHFEYSIYDLMLQNQAKAVFCHSFALNMFHLWLWPHLLNWVRTCVQLLFFHWTTGVANWTWIPYARFLNYGYINIIYLAISLIILPLFSENRHDEESIIRNKISTGGTYTVVCVWANCLQVNSKFMDTLITSSSTLAKNISRSKKFQLFDMTSNTWPNKRSQIFFYLALLGIVQRKGHMALESLATLASCELQQLYWHLQNERTSQEDQRSHEIKKIHVNAYTCICSMQNHSWPSAIFWPLFFLVMLTNITHVIE